MVWPFLKGDDMSTPDAKEHWEQHYGERDRVWSGRVNAAFAEIVEPLKPGTALDLGCGEGGDADVARRARLAGRRRRHLRDRVATCGRGRRCARAWGTGSSSSQHDLSESFPEGAFDLVSAQFLHSTLPLDRTRIFQRAADAIRPGGLLLIVDHGGAPPWASKLHHHHEFPSADEVVAALDLPDAEWERLRVEAVEREATGPNGEAGTLVDNVIVLRRSD